MHEALEPGDPIRPDVLCGVIYRPGPRTEPASAQTTDPTGHRVSVVAVKGLDETGIQEDPRIPHRSREEHGDDGLRDPQFLGDFDWPITRRGPPQDPSLLLDGEVRSPLAGTLRLRRYSVPELDVEVQGLKPLV